MAGMLLSIDGMTPPFDLRAAGPVAEPLECPS
jgi:hypothetical protein